MTTFSLQMMHAEQSPFPFGFPARKQRSFLYIGYENTFLDNNDDGDL